MKRWIKEVGVIPVLLVIFTEEKPLEALKLIFTRSAFILFTYSIMVIKYIPELGRDYSHHSGVAQITGIAAQKNSLGEIVAVCGVFLLWQLLERWDGQLRHHFRAPALQLWITFAMGLWLLYQCDSKTSMLTLALGSSILCATRVGMNRNTIVTLCLTAGPVFFLLEGAFNISEPILRMLGRDPTLTNRTEIWSAISERPVNPIVGAGFLNYWDMTSVNLDGTEVALRTAHNGYLDIYLDGGTVGVVLLALMLLGTGARIARFYMERALIGAPAFAFFCMTLLANVSESVFARRSPLWVCFIIAALLSCGLVSQAVESTDHEISGSGIPEPEPIVPGCYQN